MDSMFADSEYEETVESQLTLGTGALLGIFFGLAMVCGIFFGFGYSFGRRNFPAASVALSAPANSIASPSPAVTGPQFAGGPPASVAPAVEPLVASLESAPPVPAISMPRIVTSSAPAARPAAASITSHPKEPHSDVERSAVISTPALVGVSRPPATAVVSASLAAKIRIPKPSAFEPVVAEPAGNVPLQRIVAGPQFTSQTEPSPYFVWTPSFDVHRKRGSSHATFVPAIRSTRSHPAYVPLVHANGPRPALVLQIAALSRQDDAEVLASSLRKGGFAPSIKSGTEDALYHVQVGPFDRDTAAAARQRLIARGYNATLK